MLYILLHKPELLTKLARFAEQPKQAREDSAGVAVVATGVT